jgi:hypothetical protein
MDSSARMPPLQPVARAWAPSRVGSARVASKEPVRDQGVPMSRACRLLHLPRSQFYYSSKRDDTDIIEALLGLAYRHP